MTRREFEKVVEEAIASLPAIFREKMENIEFRVAESPNKRQARDHPDGLYGLYEGVPLGDRSVQDAVHLPDRITIFKRAIERDCKTRAEVIKCIQETVLHEVGHFFGFDDDQLDAFGIG
jgi:predicted Zn-dependent protease with MMP-like domain